MSNIFSVLERNIPAFYALPTTIDDVVTQTVARALELLDVGVPGVKRWDGGAAVADNNGHAPGDTPSWSRGRDNG